MLSRLAWIAILLSVTSMLSACDVTGVAAPSGQNSRSGKGLQFIGEPGANAP